MDEVNISIQGLGLSFNGKTDFFRAGQIITFLNSPQNVSQASGTMNNTNTPQRMMLGETRQSPREAILQAGAKTNAQKIAVLANYLLQDGGKTTFNAAEIRPLFARAGEPVPKNFSRDMQQAIHDCYIFESVTQTGEYELTDIVPDLIKKSFASEENRTPRRTNANPRSSSGSKKEINEALVSMEYMTNMDGYVEFRSLTKKGQKILWILLYAKNHGVEALNTTEVSFIATKFNEDISASAFSALNEGNKKHGYVAMKNDKYRILQKGIDVLTLPQKTA